MEALGIAHLADRLVAAVRDGSALFVATHDERTSSTNTCSASNNTWTTSPANGELAAWHELDSQLHNPPARQISDLLDL